MTPTADYRLPATQLDVVVDSRLQPDFAVLHRSTEAILGQSVVKVDTRLMLDRAYLFAKRSGIGFNIARFRKVLARQPRPVRPRLREGSVSNGESATPFSAMPPSYPQSPVQQAEEPEKAGAAR